MSSALKATPMRNPVRTRDRILDRAEAMFAERGYRGSSLAEIADQVGIRGPSLFSHFKSKRALYEAVMERLLDPFFALLEELSELPDDGNRTATALARLVSHNAENPRLSALIQQAVLEGGEQLELLVERWYRPYSESVTDLLSPERSSDSAASNPVARGTNAAVLEGRSRARTTAFNTLVLGYFSLAPLHAKLLGFDPLSREALDAHTHLLHRLDVLLQDG